MPFFIADVLRIETASTPTKRAADTRAATPPVIPPRPSPPAATIPSACTRTSCSSSTAPWPRPPPPPTWAWAPSGSPRCWAWRRPCGAGRRKLRRSCAVARTAATAVGSWASRRRAIPSCSWRRVRRPTRMP